MPTSRTARLARCTTLALAAACLAGSTATSTAEPAPRRLTLAELTALALQGPRASMARHDNRAARAQAAEARAARYPKLNLNSFVAPSPVITCDNPECTRTTPTDVTLDIGGVFGGATLSGVQPLYTFGKIGAITQAAQAAVQATARLEDAVAGDLAVDAARAYYGLKLARELRWMLEDGLAEIEKALTSLEERLEEGSGEATVQDRLRVETLRAEVKARLSEARQAETLALAGVRTLARDPDADIDEEPLEPVELELARAASYTDRARASRPELEAARAGAEAARAKQELESSRYWPDLALVGEAKIARAQSVDDPPSAFASDPFNTTSAAIGLVLRWQLDPMAQRARVAQARARSDRASALVEAVESLASFEAQAAHGEAVEAKKRVEAAIEGVKSARGWVAAVLQAEAVGAVETKDLADAFIAYFTLKARHATSIFEWNLATVRLGRVTGEFTAPRARR
jgi:protease secretion system outer membrane protein